MRRTALITAAGGAVVIVGLAALAAPALASVWTAAAPIVETVSSALAPSPDPVATDPATDAAKAGVPEDYVSLGDGISRPAGGPGDCTTSAFINITSRGDGPAHGKLLGELVDMGASELASGTAILDTKGAVVAYEVAPGDSLIAIGERFCIDYYTVGSFNHATGTMIHPGDVLYLRPDPTIPWVNPYVPYDAQPGTSTIPYYDAVAEFSNAVAARDLAATRSVWDRLSADVDPATRAFVAQALSEGNWTLLRQMFP